MHEAENYIGLRTTQPDSQTKQILMKPKAISALAAEREQQDLHTNRHH